MITTAIVIACAIQRIMGLFFNHKIKSNVTEVGLKSNSDIVDAGTGDADLSRSDAICPDVG